MQDHYSFCIFFGHTGFGLGPVLFLSSYIGCLSIHQTSQITASALTASNHAQRHRLFVLGLIFGSDSRLCFICPNSSSAPHRSLFVLGLMGTLLLWRQTSLSRFNFCWLRGQGQYFWRQLQCPLYNKRLSVLTCYLC